MSIIQDSNHYKNTNDKGIVMIKLTIKSSGKSVTFPEKVTVSHAVREAGLKLDLPCSGRGVCGKCKVKISGELSSLTDFELMYLEPGERLACTTYITGNAVLFSKLEEITLSENKTINLNSNNKLIVDIGTTNIKRSLIDISKRKSTELETFRNPLSAWGTDVISLIKQASDKIELAKMTNSLREKIFEKIIFERDDSKDTPEIFISGNTVMLYIFRKLNPQELGVHPYKITLLSPDNNSETLTHNEIKLNIFYTPVYSAFLGGDFSGSLALMISKYKQDNILFADIGTNGELFLRINETIRACSVPMGPALEGGNIKFGSPGGEKAAVHFDKKTGFKISAHYAGQSGSLNAGEFYEFTGSCLIDVIAHFLKEELISHTGEILKGNETFPLKETPEGKSLFLNKRVYISQKDIRNFQLAKGAFKAALLSLLKAAQTCGKEIKYFIAAGNFGSYLNPDNFKACGFLPDNINIEFRTEGNTSLKSAESIALQNISVSEILSLKERTNIINLDSSENFQENYIESLNFPEKRK